MNEYYIPRCVDENGKGLVIKDKIDCETSVVDPYGNIMEPIDYDGVLYVPCNIGDRIIMNFEKSSRTFKVISIDISGHFFVCEILYTDEELVEVQLLNIAEQVKAGTMTTNDAHLQADQLIMTILYKKGFSAVADAFNKVPKYYE